MINALLRKIKFLKDPLKYALNMGVKVGSSTKISTNDFGSEPFLITIGNNCHITKGVKFITHDGGVWLFRKEIPLFDVFGKITIGDNVYVGNNAVIMPGVRVENNVVIGANSMVTKSIPSNVVAAGIPAKIICSISDYKERMRQKNFNTKGLKGEERKQAILAKIAEFGIVKEYMK